MGSIDLVSYLIARHEFMRNKRVEKLLERRRKAREAAQKNIELADILSRSDSMYTNQDGTIDWDRLAKHVREALHGR
jgi:hypothetical protein